jgi:hypothetical protein
VLHALSGTMGIVLVEPCHDFAAKLAGPACWPNVAKWPCKAGVRMWRPKAHASASRLSAAADVPTALTGYGAALRVKRSAKKAPALLPRQKSLAFAKMHWLASLGASLRRNVSEAGY